MADERITMRVTLAEFYLIMEHRAERGELSFEEEENSSSEGDIEKNADSGK